MGWWWACRNTTSQSLDREDFRSSVVGGGVAGEGGRFDRGTGGGGRLRSVDGCHSRSHIGAVDHSALKNCAATGRGGLLRVWLENGLWVRGRRRLGVGDGVRVVGRLRVGRSLWMGRGRGVRKKLHGRGRLGVKGCL